MDAQALRQAGYSSEAELQAAIQQSAQLEQAQRASANIPSQYSQVIIPKGFKYGVGASKEQMQGHVGQITQHKGDTFYTIFATNSKGQTRTYHLVNPEFARTNSGFKVNRKK